MVDQLVRPPTITKAVADTLREAILCGELEQGEPLREVELSQSLDVARGTLREALRMLQEDGLVETISHRGTFVTKLSARKVREVYTMREL
ncbi:MAG: GntR family transcriptional regulator, partial [Chloroflexi bacterium]|nr:GntR family transcriptional regulator [Chloroflexota bacterium]